MTRHEIRQQLLEELRVDAERLIDQELAAITRSYNGCHNRAVGMIDMAMGLRLLSGERCDSLKQQALAISRARKHQIEVS